MNTNFSTMLKSTLNKMKERINEANKTWEQENDQKMMEKFREIVDTGNANNNWTVTILTSKVSHKPRIKVISHNSNLKLKQFE